MIPPRPYQADAVQAAQQCLQTDDSTLVVMATGLGKSIVIAEVARYYLRTLIMVHRKELVDQLAKTIKEQLGIIPGIDLASRRSCGEPIIIGSVQSLISRVLAPPDLIIIDEAHHAPASTYRAILARYPNAKLLGVTATPDRADHLALGALFNSVAYKYETPQAIKDGWLAPIIWDTATDILDLQLAAFGRRTVVFTPTVASAKEVAEQLHGGVVHGKMTKKLRAKTLASFIKGDLQYMVNCNILTEGFDCPEIECVAMLRTIQSRGMFVQCLGRGLRKAPGKVDCLYLDLAMTPEHSLEGPENVLGGLDVNTQPRLNGKNYVKSLWEGWYS